MNVLKEIVKQVKPAEPVFYFVQNSWRNNDDKIVYIECEKDSANVAKFDGEIDSKKMHLINLVMESVREYWSRERKVYYIDESETLQTCQRKIEQYILNTLPEIMPQKQPRETKMFKWWRDHINGNHLSNDVYKALVHLYNYRCSNESSPEIDKNTLAILTLLYNQNS